MESRPGLGTRVERNRVAVELYCRELAFAQFDKGNING